MVKQFVHGQVGLWTLYGRSMILLWCEPCRKDALQQAVCRVYSQALLRYPKVTPRSTWETSNVVGLVESSISRTISSPSKINKSDNARNSTTTLLSICRSTVPSGWCGPKACQRMEKRIGMLTLTPTKRIKNSFWTNGYWNKKLEHNGHKAVRQERAGRPNFHFFQRCIFCVSDGLTCSGNRDVWRHCQQNQHF